MKNSLYELSHAYPLIPVFKDYDWGSVNALQQLTGKKELEGKPLAEMWMGSHKKGDGEVVLTSGEKIKLSEFIKTNPAGVLGERVCNRYDSGLPFLFKIIAAEKPLSIQVHPSKREAETGYNEEERKKIGIESPERNYKDKNHKPELLYALTDFHLMKGFMKLSEIEENIMRYCPLLYDFYEKAAKGSNLSGIDKVRELFGIVLFADYIMLKDLLKQLLENTGKYTGIIPDTIKKFFSIYGHDRGVASPLFLNIIELKPGQSIFIPSGELHAYISGTGFEIMANSDNVIRGGLTSKNADAGDMLKIARFGEAGNSLVIPETRNNEKIFATEADEFVFSVISLDKGSYDCDDSEKSLEIFFCKGGQCSVSFHGETPPKEFCNGECFIIPACAAPYSIKGSSILYRAAVKP